MYTGHIAPTEPSGRHTMIDKNLSVAQAQEIITTGMAQGIIDIDTVQVIRDEAEIFHVWSVMNAAENVLNENMLIP